MSSNSTENNSVNNTVSENAANSDTVSENIDNKESKNISENTAENESRQTSESNINTESNINNESSKNSENGSFLQPEAESKKKKFFKGFISIAVYFLVFSATIILSEVFLRYRISGKITRMNLAFLFFVPAEAMFFTAFAGFFKNIGNKITLPFVLLVINLYYCIQFVYFRIFGSLFSVSMMGMGGTAVGNFFWAMEEVLIASIIFLTIFLAPTLISIFVSLIKKIKYPGYHIVLHLLVIALAVGLWFGGIGALKLAGTDRQSAYYVLKNNSSDTDTTASHLGTMATFLVESGAYYLGIGNQDSESDLVTVSKSDFELVADNASGNLNTTETTETVNTDAKDENEIEAEGTAGETEEVKEKFKPEPRIDPVFDFSKLAEESNDKNNANLYTYLAEREPSYTNEYTGLFEGYNLIYICGEAFWTYACDERVSPTLYKMAHNGVVLDNYYNSFLNTTTNGEFAFTTSLWPDVSRWAMAGTDVGSFPQSAGKFMPYGVGDFFSDNGINTYGFHNYYGTYYRRYISWPNIGFNDCKFMGEMKFTSNWPSSDLEMMEQSVNDYINDDRFFAYYMTFSGHGPYSVANSIARKNIEEVKERLGEDAEKYNTEALNYLACNFELEKAMTYLLERLEEAGKLDNTVIVLTGDHYPYYLSETGRTSLCQKEIPELEQYHSTCVIYNAGLEEPIHNEEYCCNVDIVPTILNLFNLPYDSRLLMGTDVFSEESMHTAVLYNKSFLNDTVEYNASTHEAVWKIDTSVYCDEALDSYLNNYLALNDSNYLASINMLKYNFYFTIWKQAGLLTDEEIASENSRAARAMQINEEQNAIEAEAERLRKEAEEAAAAAEAEAAAAEGNN
ncbi:MAG: LTA synthase family protein [Lachnospiraceae bacterium]|nr:LTA synthase family protein [Lachnospiraceae bacterium]